MIQSMTGFGKATTEFANRKITVELKSLNSKGIDITTKIATLYHEKDVEIRNLIAQRLIRGKVDFALYYDDIATSSSASVNMSLLRGYKEQLEIASEQLGIAMPENLMEVLVKMPDVLKTNTAELDEQEWNAIVRLLNDVCDHLDKFRKQEGAALEKMFEEKLETIENLLAQVEPYEKERIDRIKGRLEENLNAIKDKIAIDPNRLEQEMIFYLEKLDINEEKVRLRNHIKYFRETMANEPAAGKKLGFIAQEMGREINTLGSKSNHSEMQIIVVKMKDQLEQIKEQVLNVL